MRLIFRPCHSRWHRDAEIDISRLLLVLVPVGDGRALLDDAEPVRGTCLEEHRLDERGLAGAAVTDDGDVADLSGLDCGHAERSFWAGFSRS